MNVFQVNHPPVFMAYDRRIDRHVYALYGLTKEEIKIIEGEGEQ